MLKWFKKQTPSLQFEQCRLFGKLPGFADFVRYRFSTPDALALDKWVSEGLNWMMQAGYSECLSTPWRFELCEQRDKSFRLASVRASHDQSGRRYPLIVTAQVTNAWLRDYEPSWPQLFQALYDFGESLALPNIKQMDDMISAVSQFEAQSLELSKRTLLEARIDALKHHQQGHAWGAAFENEHDCSHWKNHVLASLKVNPVHTIPLGSECMIPEVIYWLQQCKDAASLNGRPLSYYALTTNKVKRLMIRHDGASLPSMQALLSRPIEWSDSTSDSNNQIYQPDMSLLDGLYYWQKGVA